MKHLVFNALLIGTIAVGMAVSAHASVSYNLTGSGFTTSTTSTDDLFQLVYDTAGSSPETISTFPTNVAYGTITMECVSTCSSPTTDTFASFTIVIDVNDSTDGGSGQFVGTSTAGTVTFTPGAPATSSSTISINWAPTTLSGAGFGNNTFTVQ